MLMQSIGESFKSVKRYELYAGQKNIKFSTNQKLGPAIQTLSASDPLTIVYLENKKLNYINNRYLGIRLC